MDISYFYWIVVASQNYLPLLLVLLRVFFNLFSEITLESTLHHSHHVEGEGHHAIVELLIEGSEVRNLDRKNVSSVSDLKFKQFLIYKGVLSAEILKEGFEQVFKVSIGPLDKGVRVEVLIREVNIVAVHSLLQIKYNE